MLPAAAVQRADGTVPSGNVTVLLSALNAATDASILPGDYTALDAGAAAPLESLGALWVRVVDDLGALLDLHP